MKPTNNEWFLSETCVKVKGKWKTLYRAVDSKGKPERITIDKSGANTAAIKALNEELGSTIEIRQNKYKNTIIEQDHRRIKRITRPMLGFKNFHCAQKTLAGIELMAMLNKGKMAEAFAGDLSPAEQFYALAA